MGACKQRTGVQGELTLNRLRLGLKQDERLNEGPAEPEDSLGATRARIKEDLGTPRRILWGGRGSHSAAFSSRRAPRTDGSRITQANGECCVDEPRAHDRQTSWIVGAFPVFWVTLASSVSGRKSEHTLRIWVVPPHQRERQPLLEATTTTTMSLIVIAGVLATGLLSVGAYRLWLKATADHDDVEVRTCTPA